MDKGKSRRQRKNRKKTGIVTALLFLLLIILILLLRKNTELPEETGESFSTEETVPVTETETEETETSTAEETTPEETTEEPVWNTYPDKSGVERQYLTDPEAPLREIEWGNPRTDEFGNPVFDSPSDLQMIRGVDVSKEQGKINWYQVRNARCDFALICADENFAANYEGAYGIGMKIGVYSYLEAGTPEEAKEEAKEFLSVIGDREIDLFAACVPENMAVEGPVGGESSEDYFREANQEKNTGIVEAFCEEIAAAGLKPAVYASLRYETEMYDIAALAGKYDIWYSEFIWTPSTPYPFTAWQYCIYGGIPGINGPVHLDLLFQEPYEENGAEEKIFSYTQFSQDAYENTSWVNYRKCNEAWNGDWAKIEAGGQEFMMFGCGICCLSNAVSTLTDTVVDPGEMYYSTKEHTPYYPESGRGAVSWENMQSMCGHYGLSMQLCRKPSDYEKFVEEITSADTAVILVNGENDRRLWWYTDGHYVGIWEYDPLTETVFVTDPSTHYNRLRVKLRDIYHALKTGSNWQFALINR